MVMDVAARDAEYIRGLEKDSAGYITTHRNLNDFHFIPVYIYIKPILYCHYLYMLL